MIKQLGSVYVKTTLLVSNVKNVQQDCSIFRIVKNANVFQLVYETIFQVVADIIFLVYYVYVSKT